MSPGAATVPWVAWDEQVAGVDQVFVSRLVGTGAGAHFEVANGGAPISTGANNSTRPDITFSGNTPYVSWREDVGGGVVKGFTGHFVNAASPTFVLDGDEVALTPTAQADVREPISSSCIATPFDADGSACQGGALGTPFFLFTNGTAPLSLFADAYQPDAPVTEAASAVGSSSATVHATVDQHGAPASVFFQYGATAAYGASTGAQTLGAGRHAYTVQRSAERACGRDDDSLSRGREQRLRDVLRRRPDADDNDAHGGIHDGAAWRSAGPAASHRRQSDGVQADDLRYDRTGPCVVLRSGFGDLPSDAQADGHREVQRPQADRRDGEPRNHARGASCWSSARRASCSSPGTRRSSA